MTRLQKHLSSAHGLIGVHYHDSPEAAHRADHESGRFEHELNDVYLFLEEDRQAEVSR